MREECLAYAMESDEPDGVWGGLTPVQRRALRPKRGRGRPRKGAAKTQTRAFTAADAPVKRFIASPTNTRSTSNTTN